MEDLVRKYEKKLIRSGLALPSGPSRPLIAGLDHDLVWNCQGPETALLSPIFDAMAINSLVFFRPAPPYDTILAWLADQAGKTGAPILPMDCETRTFLHDLPVVGKLSPESLLPALSLRKGAIVAPGDGLGPGIIAHGTVSPEQGFVTASSMVFACFVKFFSDYLFLLQTGEVPHGMHAVYKKVLPLISRPFAPLPGLMKGLYGSEETVYAAMIEAGKATVDFGLVDSYFGNISYCRDGILYISQTGSSLDELAGCIDPVPLDHSSSAGLTASSELTAHLETIARTGARAILHGHPKFSVILSMDCDPATKGCCAFNTRCHTLCPEKRSVQGIPIVPGEVGTGPTGLCNTLPRAFDTSPSAIVYGHGLFTLGERDFTQAFERLYAAEALCREVYLDKVARLRQGA